MRHNPVFVFGASLALLVAAPLALVAQSPRAVTAPKTPGGIDRRLLDGLDTPPSPASQTPKPLDRPYPQGTWQSKLATIADSMRSVEGSLARHDLSPSTLQAQRQIADDLAALLEQARQNQASANKQRGGAPGSQRNRLGDGNPATGQTRELAEPAESRGHESAGTANVKQLLSRIWGHLPDKLRDQMQASLSEQFLPQYEQLIEDYYRRLAEDRPGTP